MIETDSNAKSVKVDWKWRAHSSVRVSYKLVSQHSVRNLPVQSKWVTPPKARTVQLSAAGVGSISFFQLKSNVEYMIRFTPIRGRGNAAVPLHKQSVAVRVKTTGTRN